jgi:glycine cleavage system H protein
MQFPDGLKYTKDHEWVRVEGDVATVGVTDFAQDALGDVVFVDLPEAGEEVAAGDTVAEIESVKAVSDVFSPLTGEIVGVNEDLDGAEESVNEDPYGAGWLFQVKLADASELDPMMDVAAYKAFVAEQDH